MIITKLNAFSTGDRVFIRVENGNASADLEPGDLVKYEPTATATYKGVSVVDSTADALTCAGFVVGKSLDGIEPITAGEFGYVQASGPNKVAIKTSGVVAAGSTLKSGAAVGVAGLAADQPGTQVGSALEAAAGNVIAANGAIIRGLL